MMASSCRRSTFGTVVVLLALSAIQPVSGGTPVLIFGNDFESGTYAGWSDKVPAECDDLIRNGDETDVDCGGLTCGGCDQGESCLIDGDCLDGGWVSGFPSCAGSVCTMGCSGEHYDVDNSTVNDCEVVDSPLGNHTVRTPFSLGSYSCADADTIQATGKVPSDSRSHGFPPVGGFDSFSGSAPDYFVLNADGGICSNDLDLVLTTTGGAPAGACYRFTVSTDVMTLNCNVSGSGNCLIFNDSGSYTDDSVIFFRVEKTCSSTQRENVSYSIAGHI